MNDSSFRIWLTRHGESQYNEKGLIGGDSDLSNTGEKYAQLLPDVLQSRLLKHDVSSIDVYTSTLSRTKKTARHLPFATVALSCLDEIDAGICDGMTYDEIKRLFPNEYLARQANKYAYRYPTGESYADVAARVAPFVNDVLLRQRRNTCVVAHQAVLRVIIGQMLGLPEECTPSLEVPLHTLLELSPRASSNQGDRKEMERNEEWVEAKGQAVQTEEKTTNLDLNRDLLKHTRADIQNKDVEIQTIGIDIDKKRSNINTTITEKESNEESKIKAKTIDLVNCNSSPSFHLLEIPVAVEKLCPSILSQTQSPNNHLTGLTRNSLSKQGRNMREDKSTDLMMKDSSPSNPWLLKEERGSDDFACLGVNTQYPTSAPHHHYPFVIPTSSSASLSSSSPPSSSNSPTLSFTASTSHLHETSLLESVESSSSFECTFMNDFSSSSSLNSTASPTSSQFPSSSSSYQSASSSSSLSTFATGSLEALPPYASNDDLNRFVTLLTPPLATKKKGRGMGKGPRQLSRLGRRGEIPGIWNSKADEDRKEKKEGEEEGDCETEEEDDEEEGKNSQIELWGV